MGGLYTEIVARLLAALLLLALPALSQQSPPQPAPQRESELKDEDATLTNPTEYVFNPLQASKELKVGDFYWKKGSHKAAAGRYLEATRWNPAFAEAWRKLGEAREKLKDRKGAVEAYKKFLELAPEDSAAGSVRQRLHKLS